MPDNRTTWWTSRAAGERLTTFARALVAPLETHYTIKLESEGTGYHDPKNHVIQANCQMFALRNARIQFRLTQAILGHEAAHALFTNAWPTAPYEQLLRQLVNALEDERIERLMGKLFRGLKARLFELGSLMLGQVTTPLIGNDEALLGACLFWRWAYCRGGEPALMKTVRFGAAEAEKWTRIRPLVEAAWVARDTYAVIELGRQILKIIGPREGYSPGLDNNRVGSGSDIPEERSDEPLTVKEAKKILKELKADGGAETPGEKPAEGESAAADPSEIDDAEIEHVWGVGGGDVFAKPTQFIELEEMAYDPAKALEEALKLPTPDWHPLPHETRGRLNFRAWTRDPEKPFLLRQAQDDTPSQLALSVLVDRSGSMDSYRSKIRLALMMIFMAARSLRVPIHIAFFGSNKDDRHKVFDVTEAAAGDDEAVKAFIAGYQADTGGEYLITGLEAAEHWFAGRPERVKVLIAIHDGQPVAILKGGDDRELSKRKIAALTEAGLLPIGLYIGGNEFDFGRLHELFPNLLQCKPRELPEQLGDLLRYLMMNQG